MVVKEWIFELTEFYCEEHKVWHRKGETHFPKCLNRFQAYHSFKVSKRDVKPE